MSDHQISTKSSITKDRRKVATYVIGYILSVYLTLAAYLAVTQHSFTRPVIITLITFFAITQFIVQLLFFLHLGTEKKPRWKLFVFMSMICVVLILVFGSLWIMENLSYRKTPSTNQVNTYMNNQDVL